MTPKTETSYLNQLRQFAKDEDSIVAEAASKVISDWVDNLTYTEFATELKDLKYVMESADKDTMKDLVKIYSIAHKLGLSLK